MLRFCLRSMHVSTLGLCALSASPSAVFGQCPLTFDPPEIYPPFGAEPNTSDPWKIAAGDFNSDGAIDLAVTLVGRVAVMLGQTGPARGSFVLHGYVNGTGPLYGITSTDFDGDGTLDLAFAGLDSREVQVARGAGDGSFSEWSRVTVGVAPLGLVAADVNADGFQDLITANGGSNSLTTLLNDGGSSMLLGPTLPVAAQPFDLAVADFNNDTYPDLVVAHFGGECLTIAMGSAMATPVVSQVLPVGSAARSVAILDFNADGLKDIATALVNQRKLVVFLGQPSGVFGPRVEYSFGPIGLLWDIAASDLDRDGVADLAVLEGVDERNGRVWLFRGNETGALESPVAIRVPGSTLALEILDVGSDGRPDLITIDADGERLGVTDNNGVVSQDPLDSVSCPWLTVSFSVQVGGEGAVYRWQRESPAGSGVFTDLADGSTGAWDGGIGAGFIVGATSSTLTVSVNPARAIGLLGLDATRIRCIGSSSCGTAASRAATLTICPGDFNCDGGVDGDDVIAFMFLWDAGEVGADFNGDGGVDGDDAIEFFGRWDAGC